MIKLIRTNNFKAQCCSCMSTTDCYEIMAKTEYGPFPCAIVVCRDCLEDLQKQIEESNNDDKTS